MTAEFTYPAPRQVAPRRLFGWSEVWRDDGTGTRTFDILFVRVWRSHFTHSTWLWE